MKRIIGVIFILLCLIPFKIFAASKVKVYVFEAGGCPFCEDQKEYLKKLDGYNTKFEVIAKELYVDHETWQEGKDYKLGKTVAEAFYDAGFSNADYNSTPFVVISDLYASSTYNDTLEEIINSAYNLGDKDVVGCYAKGNTSCGLKENLSLDSDTSLKSLVVSVGELNPTFNKEINDYKIEVRGNIEEVNVNAECNGINCRVEGTGLKKLVEGNNEIVIKVTAENGEEEYYRINIYREENYYKHLYIGVAGALVIIITTLIGLIWSIVKKNKNN